MNLKDKKVKCIHCGAEVIGSEFSSSATSCKCKKVIISGNIITEGVEGKDWVNVAPRLLNEAV